MNLAPRAFGKLSPLAALSLATFSAAALGAGLGRAIVTTYLPVLLARLQEAPGLIGMVMLVNTAAGFAVPLAAGLWSDRLHARGRGRTVPFVLGGSVLAAGGLSAMALGHGSSYAALALFAAAAYAGLNAITTLHRALIPETFPERERAAATAAEEFALLAGGLAGLVAGGVLIERAAWAPFAFGAVALPLLALPTVARMRGRELPGRRSERQSRRPLSYYARAATAPGARLLLAAQALWVLGYIGLPPFFILYAEHELEVGAAAAAGLLAVFGVVAALAVLAAALVPEAAQGRTLVLGVALMGGGLLGVAATTSVGFVGPALLAAAVGYGLVSTLGFTVYARFVPPGEEGAYTALFFSVRSLSSAVGVPAAGWLIAFADTYRAMFVLGGASALAALIPLVAASAGDLVPRRPSLRGTLAPLIGLLAVTGSLLGLGILVVETRLARADARLFEALNGLGGTPRIVDRLLVDPHIQNYVTVMLIAAVAAVLWRPRELVRVLALVPLAGLVSFGAVRLVWAVWSRGRPEEVLGVDPANGHVWASYPSFPSGHVAVTVALAAAVAFRIPWLGPPLALYSAVIAVTRVSYGAHFPLDVAAGVVLGLASAAAVASVLADMRLLDRRGRRLTRPIGPIPPAAALRLRQAGTASGVAVVALFVTLGLTVGAPQSPEGGLMPQAAEVRAQYALLALGAAGLALAHLRPTAGGAVVIASAVGLGVLASLEYDPLAAAFACFGLFAPGLLLVLGSRPARSARGLALVATTAAAVLLLGAFGAFRVHDIAYGATHPESPLRDQPETLVRWSWAGAVTPTSFRVTGKVSDDGDVRLLVGRDPRLRDAVHSAPERADHDLNDRIVAFGARSLEPWTTYYYALELGGEVDLVKRGRVRTFPVQPASFTIAIGSCARVGSNGAVFDAIRRQRPLFFLIAGDFFYANIESNDEERFRDEYETALTRPAQAALYRTAPIAYVWDDHDFGPNDADASSPSRSAAQSSYRSLVPHYPLASPGGAIYQAFSVGRTRFILTDLRSARTQSSMLGAEQKAWLKRELAAASRRGQLAVWLSTVPWIVPAEPSSDSWAGWDDERRELADFIARHRIRNLVMIAGDAHMVALDDGSNSDFSSSGEAGFPVLHAAALDRRAEIKGGPYSAGAIGGSGQFGTLAVQDSGGPSITVTLTGWNYRSERLVERTFTRVLEPEAVP